MSSGQSGATANRLQTLSVLRNIKTLAVRHDRGQGDRPWWEKGKGMDRLYGRARIRTGQSGKLNDKLCVHEQTSDITRKKENCEG